MIELLKDRALLSVTGVDALQFLQNMTSNDLIGNTHSHNYLLSPQGRYLYDFFVSKISAQEIYVDVAAFVSQELLQKLTLYKMRKELALKDVTSDYAILYSCEKLPASDYVVASYKDPRFCKLGFRSIVKTAYTHKLELGDANLYFEDKYEFTIPDGITDLIYDSSLPFHFGGEELASISFSKGCYIGQEVVSRAKYQGTARKKLFKIIADAKIAPTKIGAEITDFDGNKIGIFCSSYNKLGIALLNEEKYLGLERKVALMDRLQEVNIMIPEWRI